jgi:hypothetical protein
MNGLIVLFAGALLNFHAPGENKIEPKGTFGGDGKNAPCIQLNENHTFKYTDLTKPSKPVVAEGTWSLEKDELILKTTSKAKLNRHYTVIREGMCIQTRKNFAFYTLCNCK